MQSNTMPDDGDDYRIGYVADVEGHWDYFLEYVQRSKVLDWEEHYDNLSSRVTNGSGITFQRLKLRPNTHFVYGGDSVDKGPGDIRLCRALVGLKKRYPDRVHLLVGNRDLNKIRFSSELSDEDMERPIEVIERPFWDPKALSFKEHLEEIKQTHAANDDDDTLDHFNTKAERLRWMLKHTLGCPDTFEFRREEISYLEQIYGCYPPNSDTHESIPVPNDRSRDKDVIHGDTTEVTDEDVVNSFEYEINHPEGSLRQYLHHSSVAAVIGNTIFVHGAIDRLTMRFVPSKHSKFELPTSTPPSFAEPSIEITDGTMIENVHEWVESLNQYLHDGLKDFETRPHWNKERTSRGGEALLAIQNRPSMWGRSVVCNSYADGGVVATDDAEEQRQEALRVAEQELNPLAFEGIASNVFDQAPADWLLAHGIKRIVVGHKPTGDCPAVLSSAYTGVEVCAVDTSFARRRDISTDDKSNRFGVNRGDAIALVEIAGRDRHNNCLEISGTLADGTEYSNTHPHIGDKNNKSGDSILGKRTVDGWWVKASVSPGSYHLCRGYGRTVEYDTRSKEDIVVCHQLQKAMASS